MIKISTALIVVLVCLHYVCNANQLDDFLDGEEKIERDSEDPLVEREQAEEFLKRFLHPFSTKNEEIKRETREVYEEKCESIVPGKRFCPDLKTWKAFKDYENAGK